jgi:transcriptional regulator with XRE-family HTH domain
MYVLDPQTILNGARVRTLRQRLHLTQKELGVMVGCFQQHISELERGVYVHVYPTTLARLAAALGVEIVDLVMEDRRGIRRPEQS